MGRLRWISYGWWLLLCAWPTLTHRHFEGSTQAIHLIGMALGYGLTRLLIRYSDRQIARERERQAVPEPIGTEECWHLLAVTAAGEREIRPVPRKRRPGQATRIG
jgi:hypothetical protein